MNTREKARSALNVFYRDEGGQGVLFAAASMLVLVAFVALVNNVGAATTRRIRTQIGTDAMAYSGAVIQANSLSAIAWTNSGMAQVYRRLMRYSVDLCATAVAAEMERLQPGGTGLARMAYQESLQKAQSGIPQAKQFLEDLSVIQNAIAIVTPELMWQEMYRIGQEHGLERIAIFPYQRMFPHEGQEASYRIEKFEDGWRITNLDSQSGETVDVRLEAPNEWRISHTRGDMVQREWRIREEGRSPHRWSVQRFEGGGLREQFYIIQVDDVWLVSPDGMGMPGPGGEPSAGVSVRHVRRPRPGGIEISYQGVTQIVRRSGGRLYRYDSASRQWDDLTQDRVQVGDYSLAVHTDNRIRIGDMRLWVGDPPHLWVGAARVTLSHPPWIRVQAAGLTIGIHGFSVDDYSISFQGHSLTNRQADGRWRMHFSHRRRLWWRHRLVEQTPEDPAAEFQWQYDYQLLGAVLRYENNLERFAVRRGIHDEPHAAPHHDDWTLWWDPVRGGVRPTSEDDPGLVMTQTCRNCDGSGEVGRGDSRRRCPYCRGIDHTGNGRTDIQVRLTTLIDPPLGFDGYRVPRELANPTPFSRQGATRWPLVLTEDFFKWGITVGGWRPPAEAPMLFDNEPDWGYVAISSARIGVPRTYRRAIEGLYPEWGQEEWHAAGGAQGGAEGEPEILYQFDDPYEREDWVENAPENLYRADLRVRLFSTREQVKPYDIEDSQLVGARLGAEAESPSSFLWNALIHGRPTGLDEASLWLDEYRGRSDHEMSERLQSMRNRDGRRLDLRSEAIDDVIRH